MSAGGPGEFHTQDDLLRVDNEVELMRWIDARFPTFNEGREQVPREGRVTVLLRLVNLAVLGIRLKERSPAVLWQQFQKKPCELSQKNLLP
jgi:hypothetical protein